MVFLGDLGHLSYSEQLHWRSFNVSSGKMSRTAFARAIEGKFEDPEDPALFLKQQLASFQGKWQAEFGWMLFKPLREDDEHYLTGLRVPLTNEQSEFDNQVMAVTRIFVDSLNERELQKAQPTIREDARGIDKLEGFLAARAIKFPKMIEFLKKLQELRSTGAAHRKGDNYDKVKVFFAMDTKDLVGVFEEILVKCVWTLNTLERNLLR